MSEQRTIAGIGSTKVPLFHLIPLDALEGIADRFEEGTIRKGDKAWNATTSNQECLTNKDFLLERISHVIHHAMKLRDQLVRGVQDGEESMYENAGSIGFGGCLLICAAKKLEAGLSAVDISKAVESSLRSLLKNYPVPDEWSLKAGRCYQTVGGESTGTLIEFNPRQSQIEGKPRQLFSKLRSDVVWLWDGTPLKVNMSLTDAEVEKFRVAYGTDGRVV